MPYIENTKRKELSSALPSPASAGELNYTICMLVNNYLAKTKKSYSDYNEVMGVMECAKLEIYRRFNVPEVWVWRRNKLEIFVLGSSETYEPVRKSRLLPVLDVSLLERCVAIRSWQQARHKFRASVSKSK